MTEIYALMILLTLVTMLVTTITTLYDLTIYLDVGNHMFSNVVQWTTTPYNCHSVSRKIMTNSVSVITFKAIIYESYYEDTYLPML